MDLEQLTRRARQGDHDAFVAAWRRYDTLRDPDRIETLEELVRLLRHQRFGRKSEKAPVDQLGLFNEAEAEESAPEFIGPPSGM